MVWGEARHELLKTLWEIFLEAEAEHEEVLIVAGP